MLVVLDGFGVASPSEGNAVTAANPKSVNYLINSFPSLTLQASGPAVGLPWGESGNSEVGHLNLGAGRVVSQDLPRINAAIFTEEFFQNKILIESMEHVKKNKSKLHLAGLVSAGAVHSLEEHLFALLALAHDQGVSEVLIHMFTDGRDTQPKVALASLDKLSAKIIEHGLGKVATVTGRFYAMDRGGHWETTEATYRAMVFGEGERFTSAREAIQQYYRRQIYDETIPPTVIFDDDKPVGKVTDGDAIIFFNFRPDRMVQMVEAFTNPDFDKFEKKPSLLQNVHFVTMTQYEKNFPVSVAFPPTQIENALSEIISKQNLSQFHIAESEKYAHVTSFFNGGRQDPWPHEEREIVTSPAAYEKRYQDVPEMSADKIGEKIIEKLNLGTNFILANFANPDMVGHTGNKDASIVAVHAVDRNLGLVFEATQARGACLIITADHGNLEELLDARTGIINKEHSQNPVPFILAAKAFARRTKKTKGYVDLASMVPDGVLGDVAPTILELMEVPQPPEMTAISLLPALLKQSEE